VRPRGRQPGHFTDIPHPVGRLNAKVHAGVQGLRLKRPSALAGLLLTLMAGTPVYAGDDDHGGQVVPPQTCAYGKTYSEWSIDWWQWATKLPATHHPLFDTADISACQSGNVWFLGGKFCALNLAGCTGIAVRTNTIPEGKALFFTMVGRNARPRRVTAAVITISGIVPSHLWICGPTSSVTLTRC
jgi:hypothetical protein